MRGIVGNFGLPTKNTHVILTICFNESHFYLFYNSSLSKGSQTIPPCAIVQSLAITRTVHVMFKHNDKLMSINLCNAIQFSGRDTLPLFDSVGIKYITKCSYGLQFFLLSNILNTLCGSNSRITSGSELSGCWIKHWNSALLMTVTQQLHRI